jgi:hypothetical protein
MRPSFGLLKTGARWAFRRQRYRGYFRAAADHLWRDLRTPGGPEPLEKALARAVERASRRSPQEWLELLASGEGPSFATLVDEVAAVFPDVLTDAFPTFELPPRDQVERHCRRAIGAALAGAPDSDQLAARILEANGGSVRRGRANLRVVSASVGALAVSGSAAYWGLNAVTDSAATSLVAALVVGVSVGVATFTGSTGAAVHPAHAALGRLVDLLLAPNVSGWKPPRREDRLEVRPLAESIASVLTSVVESTREHASEVLWRWSGEECRAILEEADRTADALAALRPAPAWQAPRRLLLQLEALLGDVGSGVEAELENGSAIFEVLVCCAAVAVELERALEADSPRPKAA